jgi:D-alanyl-lipoteichoic acid acyltransferase DltB (MBOAT superfamily)
MLFVSGQFLIFLTVVIILFILIPWTKGRRLLLLAASYYFYGCWGLRFIFFLSIITLVSYVTGHLALRKKASRQKSVIKAVGIGIIVLVVFACKIPSSIIDAVFEYIGPTHDSKRVSLLFLLPAGLSFYSFQAISYIIDLEKKVSKDHSFLDYALYLSFFPQILAGPIEKPDNMISQLIGPLRFSKNDFSAGLEIIILGLFKKVAIADQLLFLTQPRLASYSSLSLLETWELMIAFALQIYFDFSGYTNIAKGVALMFGIRLSNNYYAPYMARNISIYWQRRHMTLSRWFRDYLYFPLGGNRKGPIRQVGNIYSIMLLSGIWHGFQMGYVAWGLLHATGISLNKIYTRFKPTLRKFPISVAPRAAAFRVLSFLGPQILTFLVVVSFFSFFSADKFTTGWAIFGDLFWNHRLGDSSHLFTIFGLMFILYSMDLPVLLKKDECFTQYLSIPSRIAVNGFMLIGTVSSLGFGAPPGRFMYFDF